MVAEIFPDGPDPLLATLAQRFIRDGATREVEILTSARGAIVSVRNDPQLGELYCLCLTIPQELYDRLRSTQAAIEDRFLQRARRLLPRPVRPRLLQVALSPRLRADRHWRSDARLWLQGPTPQRVEAAEDAPGAAREATRRSRVGIANEVDPGVEVGDLNRGARERPAVRERPEPAVRRYKSVRIP